MNAPEETQPVYACPNCSGPLARQAADHGVYWSCPRCGGRAVGLGLLEKTHSQRLMTHLWTAARSGPSMHPRPCPVCGALMSDVSLPDEQIPTLDVCRRCEMVWFDPNEYEQLPTIPQPATPSLPKEAEAILKVMVAEEKWEIEKTEEIKGLGGFAMESVSPAPVAVVALVALVGMLVFFTKPPWQASVDLAGAYRGQYTVGSKPDVLHELALQSRQSGPRVWGNVYSTRGGGRFNGRLNWTWRHMRGKVTFSDACGGKFTVELAVADGGRRLTGPYTAIDCSGSYTGTVNLARTPP